MRIQTSDGTSIHPHTLQPDAEARALELLTPRERQRLAALGYVKVYRDRRWMFTLMPDLSGAAPAH
jgi:hypothetical protein